MRRGGTNQREGWVPASVSHDDFQTFGSRSERWNGLRGTSAHGLQVVAVRIRADDSEVPAVTSESDRGSILKKQSAIERRKNLLVESPTTLQIRDWQVEVIEHAPLAHVVRILGFTIDPHFVSIRI